MQERCEDSKSLTTFGVRPCVRHLLTNHHHRRRATSRRCAHTGVVGRRAAHRLGGQRPLGPADSLFPETSCRGPFAMELPSPDFRTVAAQLVTQTRASRPSFGQTDRPGSGESHLPPGSSCLYPHICSSCRWSLCDKCFHPSLHKRCCRSPSRLFLRRRHEYRRQNLASSEYLHWSLAQSSHVLTAS